jgi:hypothetical protein
VNCPHGCKPHLKIPCGACVRAADIVRALGGCQHRRIDEQQGYAWCNDCGAMLHDLADGWTLPLMARRALAEAIHLDGERLLAGASPRSLHCDSDAKIVNRAKSRT